MSEQYEPTLTFLMATGGIALVLLLIYLLRSSLKNNTLLNIVIVLTVGAIVLVAVQLIPLSI